MGLLPGRAGRLLARRPGRHLSLPMREQTSPIWAAGGGGAWHEVVPAGPVVRRPPIHHGAWSSRLLAQVDATLPAAGVAVVPGGIVAGAYGWVVTPDGSVLIDHAWHGTAPVEGRARYQIGNGPDFAVRQLLGTTLTLASMASWKNHAHFLLDSVSRLHLVEAAGFRLDRVDHVLATPYNEGAWRILERLGVSRHKVIVPEAGVAYRSASLIAPSFPGSRRNYPAWVPAFLRSRLAPPDARPFRRLYVPRVGGRLVENIAELMPVLEAHRFDVFDPPAHPDPISVFAEAAVVIGAHGAGLAGLAMCAPGTAVLELLPSEHQYPYYYTLADAAGLDYGYLIGPSLPTDLKLGAGKGQVSFRVDRAELAAAVATTVARSPHPG